MRVSLIREIYFSKRLGTLILGGSIFPPDGLNINDELLPIINKTITCNDLTLKYLANIKGIP